MIDYSKVDAEELQDEIDRRQWMGPEGRTEGIYKIFGLYHQEFNPDPEAEAEAWVFNSWQFRCKPVQALKCEMCRHRPLLTVSCHWSGGGTREWFETDVRVSHWIECKCGPRQEFRAKQLFTWPNQQGFKASYHTALQLIGEWNRSLRRKIKARTM